MREAIDLVFRRFNELQSIRQVHVWLRHEGIMLSAVNTRARRSGQSSGSCPSDATTASSPTVIAPPSSTYCRSLLAGSQQNDLEPDTESAAVAERLAVARRCLRKANDHARIWLCGQAPPSHFWNNNS
ncbi:hypothetical protein [Mesorhizobium sp. STM 4661]|uniref:hypothetical protein n=1 Tax=Mesorhizobium sp. STM 4661 TaxID=1297570 RepID=UPI0002BD7BB9|nr:hypothetical protein [Mesorhizobium sp. STM 4661]CCV10435.1 hypothetical protein MESS4_20011 [Mesorhizobium sp. STM 4661]